MIDHMSRPFTELRDSGVLWAVNRALFHPRGFALALCRDSDGNVTGWRIIGDGTEPWVYEPSVDEDRHFTDFEATLRAAADAQAAVNADAYLAEGARLDREMLDETIRRHAARDRSEVPDA